jgi:hypothetical protein
VWRLALSLVLVVAFAGSSFSQEKHLRMLERTMLMSYVLLDFMTLSHLLADDYTAIGYDGTVQTKRQVVESVRSAAIRVDSIPVSEPKSKLFGNVALLTGIRKYYRAGRIVGVVRYSEIWELRRSSWQCSKSQLTAIAANTK